MIKISRAKGCFAVVNLKVLIIKLKTNIMLFLYVPKYKSTSILEPCIFQ